MLPFNTTTGTISGVPIATSDPVTYTVTAALMAMMEVDRRISADCDEGGYRNTKSI
jgi:hypothetical protein